MLADAVDAIHIIVIIFMIGGFFVHKSRHSKFREFHSTFGVVVFMTQLTFSFRCPLTLLSDYLRELSRPDMVNNTIHEPFTIQLLRAVFNFETPAIVISIVTFIGVSMMFVTLISLKKPKAV
jgi:uncharacterized membrane protein YfhO